jgi:hypothetical protein
MIKETSMTDEQLASRFRKLLRAKCSSTSELDQQLIELRQNQELFSYLIKKALGKELVINSDFELYLAQVLLKVIDTEQLSKLVDISREIIRDGDSSKIPEFKKIASEFLNPD